jgi:Cdc6-like AAA superfamily ATPase
LKELRSQEILNAAIQTLKETISIHDTTISIRNMMHKFVLSEEDEKVLSWLNANTSQNNHNKARKKHQSSTGEWLLLSPTFTHWINSPKSSLWLYGKAGAGKTILCSTVIENVLGLPNLHCAYFYFDFEYKWNIDNMLRSVIAQVCRSTQSVPLHLHQVYRECFHGQRQPFTSSLIEILLELEKASTKIVLILDALDECGAEPERGDLLEALEELVKRSNNLRLFVTSRKESDIERSLKPIFNHLISLQENVVQSDIDVYVRETLKNDVKLRDWDDETKSEIEHTLVKGAEGMYSSQNYSADLKV